MLYYPVLLLLFSIQYRALAINVLGAVEIDT